MQWNSQAVFPKAMHQTKSLQDAEEHFPLRRKVQQPKM
jgi:hypothetical protein